MDELIEVMKDGHMKAGDDTIKTEEGSTIIPIKVSLPDDLVVVAGTIARNQGKNLDDFVKESVEYRMAYYISNRATGVWKDGAYLPDMTPQEIEEAAIKWISLDDERVPCKVVCERTQKCNVIIVT